MAPVSFVNMGAFWDDASNSGGLFQRLTQPVVVKRMAVQGVGVEDESAPFPALWRRLSPPPA